MARFWRVVGGERGGLLVRSGRELASAETWFSSSTLVPFFSFWVPLFKPNSRKKGTLIIKGLLGNLGEGGEAG